MKENERIKIGLLGGEMEKDVLTFMKDIGLDFTAVKRRYLH